MWGIIPAAGAGTRIQPLACSKELLPVGGQHDGVIEHPRAVSEYLVDRMRVGGAEKICFVIGPKKHDIVEYYSTHHPASSTITFVIQPSPQGLCDALFRCVDLVPPDEQILIGLPDTIWFPEDGFAMLPDDVLSFLLFPVTTPALFDAVIFDEGRDIREIQVKQQNAQSNWIWGAFKLPGHLFRELYELWCERDKQDEYVGTLVNAWITKGRSAIAVPYGNIYVDVGTLPNYRKAIQLLNEGAPATATGI
jgi:glucose-1-phosphate thymidylyltransferase